MSHVAYQEPPQNFTLRAASVPLRPSAPFGGTHATDASNDAVHAVGTPSLQVIIDAMAAEVAVIGSDMRVVAGNTAWHRLLGRDRSDAELIGRDYSTICGKHPEGRDARYIRRGLRRLQRGVIPKFVHHHTVVVGGENRHFLVHTAHLRQHGNLLLACYADVTESRRHVAERRQYCVSLMRAEEEERKRIARELHDETAQQLALMQFGLAALKAKGNDQDVGQVCARLEDALGAVQQQLRTLSYVLHPPELEGAGIEGALSNFVKGFARRAGLIAEFTSNVGSLRLSRDVEIAFYRVAQEALVNVQKHAAASHVSVCLKWEDGDLILQIADNGIGITDSLVKTRSSAALGVGLVGMRERLEVLAGRLDISRLPLGTMVTARVPRRRHDDI